jgi:hypothetical protein
VTGHQLVEQHAAAGTGPRALPLAPSPARGQFCAIRSYLSTAAKHGLGVFDGLIMLTKGQPWMPASPDQTRTLSATYQSNMHNWAS